METILSILNLLPSNKTELQDFMEKLEAEVCDGYTDIAEFAVKIKILSDLVTSIKDNENIKREIVCTIERANNELVTDKFVITLKSKTTYDYSGDSVYSQYKEKIKEREAMLKNIKEAVADPETGELIYPAVRTHSTFYEVKIKK